MINADDFRDRIVWSLEIFKSSFFGAGFSCLNSDLISAWVLRACLRLTHGVTGFETGY